MNIKFFKKINKLGTFSSVVVALVIGFVFWIVPTGIVYSGPQDGSKHYIIDCHEHIQSLEQAKKLIAVMDRIGIEKMVLVGSSWFTITMNEKYGFTKYDWNNNQLLKIVEEYQDRFEAWPTINPLDDDKLDKLKSYIERGATGLKLYTGHGFPSAQKPGTYFFHPIALDDPTMFPIYEYCEENFIPICFHVNPGPTKPGFAQELIAVLDAYPNLKVNVPHFMLSSIKTSRLRTFLETYPNLWTDTSFGFEDYQIAGLKRFSKNMKKYRDLFRDHPDRIMFATDNVITSAKFKTEDWLYDHMQCYVDMLASDEYTCSFVKDKHGKITKLNGLGLSDELLEKVFYKNYEEFISRKPIGTVKKGEIDWSRMGVVKLDRKPGQSFSPPALAEKKKTIKKNMKKSSNKDLYFKNKSKDLKKNEVVKAAYFPNLIPNPRFEVDKDNDLIPDFWRMEGFEQKEGLPTSATIALRGRKAISINGKGTWHCTINNIEPHKYYLFSLWTKRDGWRDDEYPTIEIFDKKMYLNELFSWGGWMRLSWYLYSGERKQTDLLLINPGMSHRIYFNRIKLIKYDINLLLPRDNSILTTSSPKFIWKIPRDDKILDLKIELSRSGDFNDKIVLSTKNALGNSFEMKEKLDVGRWYWKIKVYKNNKMITSSETKSFFVKSDFFPIGIYGATEDVFSELKEAGFNCILASPTKDFVLSAKENGLKCIISIRGKILEKGLGTRIKEMINSNNILCWYLEDEPEGRSISPMHIWKLGNYIHSFDEEQLTGLALVRSKRAIDYGDAVDVLMIDTYPVPRMPMTWLSDSIDESRSVPGYGKQVWAIIQAFDWSYFRDDPRLKNARNPTFEEERCLTYLAIVHGAKGILYYTYSGGKYKMKNFPEHWNDIKRIASELNMISSMLIAPNINDSLILNLTANVSTHTGQEPKGTDTKHQFVNAGDSHKGNVNESNTSFTDRINATDANGKPAIHYLFKEVSPELLRESNLLNMIGKDIIKNNQVTDIVDGKSVRFIIAVNVINTPINAAFLNEQLLKNNATVLFEDRIVEIENGKLTDYFKPYEVHIYMLEG